MLWRRRRSTAPVGSQSRRLRRLPQAWVSEEAVQSMRVVSDTGYPYEVGGILVGVTALGRPWITHAVSVPSSRQSRCRYLLPTGARLLAVDEIRRTDSRIGYLGDWHSHTSDVGPSSLDLRCLGRLAEDPEAGCPGPLLIVVRRREAGYSLDARVWTPRGARPIRLVDAGSLGPAESSPSA